LFFYRWFPNEPNNSGNSENCGEINNEKFNDVNCAASKGFICEADSDKN
jgi:hypothetical protein